MTANEKKFLDELTKLLVSYAIDEVICEEDRYGEKFIVIHSNDRFLSFRVFKEGIYYDIMSNIPKYVTQWGGTD